jgi:acetylglutamate kinase
MEEANELEVWKIGGNELDSPEFLQGLAQAVQQSTRPVVIVHGGGQAITNLQERLGVPVRKVDGFRITGLADLEVVQLVLIGDTNKRIVLALLQAGVDALGISGLDGGLLRCVPKQHSTLDLGWVGEIHSVRADIIHNLLGLGYTPVVAPVSLGQTTDGAPHAYNVNADDAAKAVAMAARASTLVFISNVPGVLTSGKVLPNLTAAQTAALIEAGVITGGMIPKVQAALAVVASGVPAVRITNLAGLLLAGTGTVFAT